MTDCIVDAATLAALLHDTSVDVVVLDASLAPVGMPSMQSVPACIPGAVFFDIEGRGSDSRSELPHTLPSAAQFQAYARELGVNCDSHIVIYDHYGLYSSARVWWMFRAMGHTRVSVLLGGFAAWQAAGFDTADDFTQPQPGGFEASLCPSWLVSVQEVLAAIDAPDMVIVDARSRGRFDGAVAEPRPGLRSGHIPESVNLPYTDLFSAGEWLSASELSALLQQLGVQKDKRLLFSCGSGITACLPLLAAWQCGYRDVAVFDGSWAEWGANPQLPVAP